MTAEVATGLSLDEFLDGNYEHSELFGGEVRPKPVPTWMHSRMEARLVLVLGRLFGVECVGPEANLKIGEESPLPDFIVMRSGAPGLYRGIVAEPPLLCVEVVSPSQTPEEMFAKCLRYRRFGVPFCWVIDPDARRAWEMSASGEFTEVKDDFLTPQAIPLSALFE
jgi:Uma2 family endonuclease